MSLGEYIQSVLDRDNMTMTVAAQKANVSASTLSRLRSGSSELTPSLAAKLSFVGFDYVRMFEIAMNENIRKTREIIKTVNG